MAVSAGAEIRPSTEADRPAIAALLDRLLTETPLERRIRLWEWRSRENPDADGRLPEFLVVEKDGRLVGAHGLFPLRMKVGQRTVRAAATCDFAVAPEGRSLGMPLKLEALDRERADVTFSTSANETAQRIAGALGSVEVPWARAKFVKPLRASGLLRGRLRGRLGADSALADWTARMVGRPVDEALRWGRAARRRWSDPEVEVEAVDFERAVQRERLDALWSRVAPRWEVAVVRDAAYLRWRYGRCPLPGVESLAARDRSETTGFAALQHHTDVQGLPCTAVLDLFGAGAAPEALLAEVVRRADARGSHYLTARAGAGGLRSLLERNGFLAREADHCPYHARANDPALEPLIADPANWRISQGDGDSGFFVA